MSNGDRTRRKHAAAQRQRQALDMRLAGHSYDDIARACGYASKSGAHKAVSTALAAIPRPSAEEYAAEMRARVLAAHKEAWQTAQRGDTTALNALARFWAALDRYSGYNAHMLADNETLEVRAALAELGTAILNAVNEGETTDPDD